MWERKVKWRVSREGADNPLMLKENYQSASLNKDRLMKEFMKQELAGTLVKMSPSEVRAMYKQRMHVAALALLEQGSDSWRVVHDGTHEIAVNNRVKVRDQISAPIGETWRQSCGLKRSLAHSSPWSSTLPRRIVKFPWLNRTEAFKPASPTPKSTRFGSTRYALSESVPSLTGGESRALSRQDSPLLADPRR